MVPLKKKKSTGDRSTNCQQTRVWVWLSFFSPLCDELTKKRTLKQKNTTKLGSANMITSSILMKKTREVFWLSCGTASSLEDQSRSWERKENATVKALLGMLRTTEEWAGWLAGLKSHRQVMMSGKTLGHSDHLSHCLICCCRGDFLLRKEQPFITRSFNKTSC